MYDFLIVGAGLFGAAAARELTDRGYRVAVVEKRDGPGGNCADDKRGDILVGRHGGHIFHTQSRRVWDFAQRFATFNAYTHRVVSRIGTRLYSFPVNLLTLNQLYGITTPAEAQSHLDDPANRAELERLFYRGYTRKQWGRDLADLPKSITARVPMRAVYDDRYFTDAYQGLPEGGYTAWIGEMLRGIPAAYQVDFLGSAPYWLRKAQRVIYTGPLDALFAYCYGRLEYRSLRFEHRTMDGDFQGCATVNHPVEDVPYTRVLEWKHFGWQKSAATVYTYEYPEAYDGQNEPYYPVRDEKSLGIYARYTALAGNLKWLSVGGRLGSYQYLNMDQAIGGALALIERLVGK